jgi:hypothetical protein
VSEESEEGGAAGDEDCEVYFDAVPHQGGADTPWIRRLVSGETWEVGSKGKYGGEDGEGRGKGRGKGEVQVKSLDFRRSQIVTMR